MPPSPASSPPVTIVMCTYNGARWLPEQLASFAAQDHDNWTLVVSDDGSSDDTCDVVRAFAKDHPVILYENERDTSDAAGALAPAQRAARNYMQTLTRPDLPLGAKTCVALSDQDDVWRPDKLSHALAALRGADTPAALYGGQSRHITREGRPLAHSRPPHRGAGLHNALVQNVVSGHSAVLTPQAMERLRVAGVPDGIWYHDWWIYLFLAATGAQILVDDHIGLDYRQHDTNVMGAGRGRAARMRRLRQIFNGEYGTWLRANLSALHACEPLLTPQGQAATELLNKHGASFSGLWSNKAYRQRTDDTICLYLAALLRRL